MKTFKDLEFNAKVNGSGGDQAKLDFDNGFGVSVITGGESYSDESNPFELAVLKDKHLCYDSTITDDVLGYLTLTQVTYYMKRIQGLKANNK